MSGLGNVLSVFVLVTLGTVCFASLGLIVASVTNTMQETQIINQIIWFVFLFISGATIPFPMLPGAVQAVAVFLPATYLVSGLQRAMIDHTGIGGLGMYVASLLGCALVAFIISAQLFRWDPEAKAPRRAKALGHGGDHSLPFARRLGNPQRRLAQPRHAGFAIHPRTILDGTDQPLIKRLRTIPFNHAD